jgi:hypothetical protein
LFTDVSDIKVKRGEMTGIGEMTQCLVSIVTARDSSGGQWSVNREEKILDDQFIR